MAHPGQPNSLHDDASGLADPKNGGSGLMLTYYGNMSYDRKSAWGTSGQMVPRNTIGVYEDLSCYRREERNMDAAILQESQAYRTGVVSPMLAGQIVSPAEFRDLLVSHRRMVRVDQRTDRLRGLRDLDTGEVFLTDERRLLEGRR